MQATFVFNYKSTKYSVFVRQFTDKRESSNWKIKKTLKLKKTVIAASIFLQFLHYSHHSI